MKVKDFVNVSYIRMIFRDAYSHDYIYDFMWDNDFEEDEFIKFYGDYDIKSFKSYCDGVIVVFIESEV